MTRKIAEILVSAVLLLVLAGNGMPEKEKPAEIAARGIDVSSHQGVIDWQAVSHTTTSFAVIRCGVSVGDGFQKDRYFEENYAGARKAGLDVGCYLYTDAVSREQMKTDISAALAVLDGRELTLPFFLDIETAAQKRMPDFVLTGIAADGCGQIEEAGYKAGVYSNYSFLRRELNSSSLVRKGYSLWMARYPLIGAPVDPAEYDFSRYAYWQYSDSGKIDGIEGPVDLNVMYQKG